MHFTQIKRRDGKGEGKVIGIRQSSEARSVTTATVAAVTATAAAGVAGRRQARDAPASTRLISSAPAPPGL